MDLYLFSLFSVILRYERFTKCTIGIKPLSFQYTLLHELLRLTIMQWQEYYL